MDNAQILARVDHTLLKATATLAEILELCGEAVAYNTASACIPPSYAKAAASRYGASLKVCTVIGFPLGYSAAAAKLAELRAADADGAAEFDVVVNLGDVKNGDFDKVTAEIAELKSAAGGKILKVIVETCYLTQGEKIALCKCVTDGGADFIKTSTGFGTGGAAIEDVRLFKAHVGPGVEIKAAGGIRTKADMEAFIAEGASRIGTSSAVKLLAGGAS